MRFVLGPKAFEAFDSWLQSLWSRKWIWELAPESGKWLRMWPECFVSFWRSSPRGLQNLLRYGSKLIKQIVLKAPRLDEQARSSISGCVSWNWKQWNGDLVHACSWCYSICFICVFDELVGSSTSWTKLDEARADRSAHGATLKVSSSVHSLLWGVHSLINHSLG